MMRGAVVVASLLGAAVQAQELPAPADLASRIAGEMPGFWDLVDFRVVASANQGDPISPRAMVRFEADASPKADLFATTGERLGPFDVVVKTQEQAVVRTLYGTMDLSYRAGEWDGRTTIENPVQSLGQPADFFNAPVLEIGSARQQELMAAMRGDAIGAARADLEAELRRIAAEGAERADKLRAETAETLRRLEQERAEQVAEARAANAASLKALEDDYNAALSALQSRFDPQLADTEARVAAETARFEDAFAERRSAMEAEHSAALAALAEAHAAALGELRAQQAAETAEIETGFALLRERLDRQFADADDIIAKQEAVIQKSETIADNKLWIDEQAAAAVEARAASMAELVGTWLGVAECGDQAIQIALEAEAATSSGVTGRIGGPQFTAMPMTMLVVPGKEAIPAAFTLSVGGQSGASNRFRLFSTADVELHADGRILGSARGEACSTIALSK